MKQTRLRARALALVGLALLLVVAAVSASSASSTAVAADFGISVDQSSLAVTAGADAVLLVDISSSGSFAGPVTISVAGAPLHATVTVLPNPAVPGVPVFVVVAAASNTPAGTYTLAVTATNGSLTHTVNVALNVSLPNGFTMSLSPSSATVIDGSSTDYALTINRGLITGPISLKVSGVPQFATATVSPSLSLLGNSATVHIATTTNVVPGVYRLTVAGSALLSSAAASAYLVVTPQTYPDFPISGSVDRTLYLGSTGLINLALTDPFGGPLSVNSLTVAVTGSSNPSCSPSNFAVTQYSGPTPLSVPANTTRTLQQLGVPQTGWPKVTLLDLPVNQNACKNVTLTLAYGGSGSGN